MMGTAKRGRPKGSHTGRTYRWNMRVQPAWVERVKAQAGRLGITAGAYVTMAVVRQLERDEGGGPAAG
jgi:hypothetical protein